VQGSVKRNPDT